MSNPMTEGAKTGTDIRYLDTLVHDTFNSSLGDTGDYEGHSVIRTESGGVWYADSIDPDDEHLDDHAEIVRRVNEYPAIRQSLTEALKVAGEVEMALRSSLTLVGLAGCEHGSTHREIKSALTALERIRNNKH